MKIILLQQNLDMKLNQVKDLLSKNLVRKNVNTKSIEFGKLENASGNP